MDTNVHASVVRYLDLHKLKQGAPNL